MKKILLLLTLSVLSIASGFSKGKDTLVVIHTRLGDIEFVLFDDTPKHKANFLKLAAEGFYDSTTFHRVIDEFMIQGGDPNSKDEIPTNDGQGGPGYTIDAEFREGHTHIFGAVAAARLGDRQNPERKSSGSQFYIVEKQSGVHFLDQSYTVFGQVVNGFDVINKIAEEKKDRRDNPILPIPMTVELKKISKKEKEKLLEEAYETAKPTK
jgi:cyclophilin family peptidyl-prolyl cis-trans isomerase